MEYFKILDLKREPFSNSPDPDFFYLSENHRDCLQKIELAVRVKRGLSVVLGEVGTGKTTLCREFLIKLNNSSNADQFETQLILDPDFDLPLEFLRTVADGFGIAYEEDNPSEWHLRERIKSYLFQKGVTEGKIVILLIDEGQKLPPFCLEKLREFLNYETNEFKLLQIVIFAQNEFQELLDEHHNFSDRVNQLLHLSPLSLRETKNLISHRLTVAGGEEAILSFFNFWSYWTIWRKTGGYPRRIISLCHQIMLSLIISKKKKATPSLIEAAAVYLPVHKTKKFPLIPVAAASGAIIAIILAVYSLDFDYRDLGKYLSRSKSTETTTDALTLPQPAIPIPPLAATPPAPLAETAAPAESPAVAGKTISAATASLPEERKAPELLGLITIQRGTLSDIIHRVYGVYTYRRLQSVMKYNPQITNINNVRPGMKITIPALVAETAPPRDKPYLIEAATAGNLEEAFSQLHNLPSDLPPMRLFAYWNRKQGTVFALYLKETYYDELSATKVLEKLQNWNTKARVIDSWDSDTVFFTVF